MATRFPFQDGGGKNATFKKHLMQRLIKSGSASIADIAKELELSIPTVTKFVGELIREGYVKDLGKQNTSGGRRPNVYGLNPKSGYFVGMDVQRKKILLATIDFNGNIVSNDESYPYELANTPEALEQLIHILTDYISHLEIDSRRILQVGMNIGGRVNPNSGFSYSYFNFSEKPLTKVLEGRIGIPVSLENDSRAMMYGEFMAGCVKKEKDVLSIMANRVFLVRLGISVRLIMRLFAIVERKDAWRRKRRVMPSSGCFASGLPKDVLRS